MSRLPVPCRSNTLSNQQSFFDSSAALERLCQSCTRPLGLTVETATSDALALVRLPSFCFSVAVVLVGSLILLLSTPPSPHPLLLPLTDNRSFSGPSSLRLVPPFRPLQAIPC